MSAVILGLSLENCDGIYPRTRDGRCQGCGTPSETEQIHKAQHEVGRSLRKPCGWAQCPGVMLPAEEAEVDELCEAQDRCSVCHTPEGAFAR